MTTLPMLQPTGTVEEEVAQVTDEPSQRFRELIDDLARKDNALEQFRALFETMSKDYEVAQRRGERAQLELETLVTKYEVQRQELLTLKAKSALQESRIKREDDEWERCTRHIRQELAVVVEERDALFKEREIQWQQTRVLRSQLEEQRRQNSEAESAWACRIEEARKETEEKVRAGFREREDLLRLREMELQRGTSQLEGRFADVSAETRRLQLTNEALQVRVEELQRCLGRQEEMTQRLQDAHSVAQKEKVHLGECMALERQAYRQRLENTENSFKVQVQELQRLCEELSHERERLACEAARAQRESKQELQRAREMWLQQQHQLESTIESLRGDLTRERMSFDKADELRQRAEALLARTRRELEASQQQEATLQETVVALRKAVTKHVATQERLESEVTRLLSAVAERERETERWRSAVDRMEWRARLEALHIRGEEEVNHMVPVALPPPSPPPPPPPLPASLAIPRSQARRASWATPCRQVRHAESIDCTSPVSSPLAMDANHLSCTAEDNDVELLRTLVQEALQECMTHMEPPSSLTHATGSPNAVFDVGRHVRAPRRRAGSSRTRRHLVSGNTRPGDDSSRGGMSLPSPITRDAPFRAVTKTQQPTSSVAPLTAGQMPSTTTSPNSSLLRARAPLFISTANNSSLESSTVSQSHQRILTPGDHNGGAAHPTKSPSLTAFSAGCEPDSTAAAVVVQKYARDREKAERQMRQTLRDLEQRQQHILSSIATGVTSMKNCDPTTRIVEASGSGAGAYNSSRVSSVAPTSSSLSSSAPDHLSSMSSSSSARASTAAPAPPSRLLALQERFETMPVV